MKRKVQYACYWLEKKARKKRRYFYCVMASPKSSDWICEKATLLLKSVFGFSEFRPGQLEAIRSVVHGNDTVVRLTTSAGKSLCYQLPPLIAGSNLCCLVISPLRALMNDQVRMAYLASFALYLLT